MQQEAQLLEDIGIYIILIVIVINTFFMWRWMRNQSKKTESLYEFIKELLTPKKE
jgi:preprotein translocase subunit YajC